MNNLNEVVENPKLTEFTNEYAFLSNDAESVVWYEGIPFPTVEHAYQASKTEDIEVQLDLADLSLKEAKHLGKMMLIRDDWDDEKDDIMRDLCNQKFHNKKLADQLKATEPFILESSDGLLGRILTGIRKKL